MVHSKMSTFAYVICFLLCACLGFKLEQSCSKFHYEEQTLEKLIRLQLFVERTKEEMDAAQNKVMDTLSELSKEREGIKADVQAVIDEINQVKSNAEKEMTTLKKHYSDTIDSYAKETAEIKESIVTPVVAFKSHIVTDKAMTDNKIVVFSTNLLNTDGSYDNQTGIFTAPLGGVYIFTAQICLSIKVRSYYAINVGGTDTSSALLNDNSYETCYTIDTITKVAKGTEITVRCKASCASDSVWENDYSKNSFSGVLIHGI